MIALWLSHMKKIFLDTELQTLFETQGYVVMPFLEQEGVTDLRNAFFKAQPDNPSEGFYSTTFSPDLNFKQKIFEQVDDWYREKVDQLFQDVKKLGASYLLKQPGEKGHMPIHQDWTVTFEGKGDFSATIWVPLEDVGPENGAIKVLPGSHLFSDALRGPTLPVIWREVDDLLEEKMVTLKMKAGEAFIFNHSLLHSSHLNQSDSPRLAVTYGLAPKDSPLLYYLRDGDRIERIWMGDELFMRYSDIGSRPDFGVSQGFFKQNWSPVSREECTALLSGRQPKIERPLERLSGQLRLKSAPPRLSLLKKESLNQQLAENGFVVFNYLDSEAVAELKAFFEAHHAQSPEGFYATAHVEDLAFRQAMNDKIKAVMAPFWDDHFDQATALGGTFIAKPPGPKGILPPHADWNIVDEGHSRSFNLWIPLVDTHAENGAVHVLPFSHDWFDAHRGPGISNPFEPVTNEIWKYLHPLEMKAGEALLYDHRLLHASPINKTDELRLACVYGVVPEGEAMRFHCEDRGLLKAFHSSPEFFMEGNPEEGPGKLELVGILPYEWPLVHKEDLQAFLADRLPHLTHGEENEEANKKQTRSFWEVYTPGNVLREIGHRLKKVIR